MSLSPPVLCLIHDSGLHFGMSPIACAKNKLRALKTSNNPASVSSRAVEAVDCFELAPCTSP